MDTYTEVFRHDDAVYEAATAPKVGRIAIYRRFEKRYRLAASSRSDIIQIRPMDVAVMSRVFRRDRNQCQACGLALRPILAIHHVIPVWLGGSDSMDNLVTLCGNCHKSVHWLSAGDRSVKGAHGYGLGQSVTITRKLLKLARRIRLHRLRNIGPDHVLKGSVSLETAFDAVARRNGLPHLNVVSSRDVFAKRCGPSVRRISSNARCVFHAESDSSASMQTIISLFGPPHGATKDIDTIPTSFSYGLRTLDQASVRSRSFETPFPEDLNSFLTSICH